MRESGCETYRGVPQVGQLVSVRRRQWIVSDIDKSDPKALGHQSQHLLTLSSIDEDALGEELSIIWELEPGALIVERSGLPEISAFDDPSHLDAFLDAIRWGAITNADRNFLQAPFRSGVTIEDFQLDPLVRAIGMARVNLLIADDVGLGKTIEAGLVIQEMLLRHRARSVLVICPSSLQKKWQDEMDEKFGLSFKIVDTEYVRQLRRDRGIHANPWTSFPRLITSQDWIKSGEGQRLLREVLPYKSHYPRKFDILVVDEAHNVAPSGSANYVLESQRTRLIREIAPHFQHKLFLTATPHNGYTESFTSLLELLDDQRFARNIIPDERHLKNSMVRRLKADLPGYAKRRIEPLLISYRDDERDAYQDLLAYCESRESASGTKAIGSKFITTLLKKRFLSSPAAFYSTLERHIESLSSNGYKSAPTKLDEKILRKAILRTEDDYSVDRDLEDSQLEAVEVASRSIEPLSGLERELVNKLRGWAQRSSHQSNAKSAAICDWIKDHLMTNGAWNNQRVILFTEYRTTQQWLQSILTQYGFGAERLAIIHGGIDSDEREQIKAAFQTHPDESPLRILLATDAASEGIDLQNHCDSLIHLEIPYNPNVMEQRNGRIDRHGQKSLEVVIWHPVDADSAAQSAVGGHHDDIIRALRKLESMREDMGSVNPVIAPQMSDLIEGAKSELSTREAELKIEKARTFVKGERQLNERIERLHTQLIETQSDYHLTPEHIEAAVRAGLALAEKPSLKVTELKDAPSGSVFEMPELAGSWAKCSKGLRHPFTGVVRPITFDHGVAKGRDDVVLVHLNHQLVQMCLRLLRAEVWAPSDTKKLNRAAIRAVPDSELSQVIAITVSRLVVTGGNHHRLHEEIIYSAGYLSDSSHNRERGVTTISRFLDVSIPASVLGNVSSKIIDLFNKHKESILKSVEARSSERLKDLQGALSRMRDKELSDIATVLDELEEVIKAELLKAEQPEQMALFTEDERTQVRRDFDALRARLARIPEEREFETNGISHRYSEFLERTFPVAVIFLIPESWAGSVI